MLSTPAWLACRLQNLASVAHTSLDDKEQDLFSASLRMVHLHSIATNEKGYRALIINSKKGAFLNRHFVATTLLTDYVCHDDVSMRSPALMLKTCCIVLQLKQAAVCNASAFVSMRPTYCLAPVTRHA